MQTERLTAYCNVALILGLFNGAFSVAWVMQCSNFRVNCE